MESSRRSARRYRAIAVILLIAACLAPSVMQSLGAQELGDSLPIVPIQARVSGRVVKPLPQSEVPVSGVVVTVHRVGPDKSGPLDSVRTDARGQYTLDFIRSGSEDAVYFAAVVYSGIAYFSAPLKGARISGDDGVITVFDTTSSEPRLTTQGHHIVVSNPKPSGEREIVEVWEVSNDSTVTFVGKDSLAPVWSTALPKGAMHLLGGEGDVAVSAIAERDGRVVLQSAFGPGIKQISYSYSLPASAFPLTMRVEKPIGVLEVLLEEQAANASGAKLRQMEAASTQGRTFRRFLGQDAVPGDAVKITMPVLSPRREAQVLIGLASLIGLAMLAALARAYFRRSNGPGVVVAEDDADTLLAAIAVLDARYERGDPTLDPVQYQVERATLKARAASVLAAGRDGS